LHLSFSDLDAAAGANLLGSDGVGKVCRTCVDRIPMSKQREPRTRCYPPPCGEGRPPKRSGSEGGRGGGRCCGARGVAHNAPHPRPPPPTPPHKGEGSTPSLRHCCAASTNENALEPQREEICEKRRTPR